MPTAPKSEILHLAELAAYNDGAVVSRSIMKSGGGNITLFAFDSGQELAEHTTRFDALLQILEGEAGIRISGTQFHLKSGDAIILPAGEPHAVQALTRFRMLLTMIRE